MKTGPIRTVFSPSVDGETIRAFVLFGVLLAAIAVLSLISLSAAADAVPVTVDDPYLEMHTGPGRGYPVFHVVDKGEAVDVLRQRTEWFRVQTRKGKRGWVHRDQLERTLQADGVRIKLEDESFGSFSTPSS